jgi:phosphatidylglycerophosphate synthase
MSTAPSHSAQKPPAKPAVRIQQNILAANERRLLNWLCARLPMWVTPDKLTILGFAGALIIATGYGLSSFNLNWLWLSLAGYLVNWFGDSLDGSLARFRKIERPTYGHFIDHSTDALATTILVGSLGLTPFIQFEVALCGLVGYLLMTIHSFLTAQAMGEFRLSFLSGGPTELRLMLMALTSAMFFVAPGPVVLTLSGFDLFAIAVSVILVSLYIGQTASVARTLRRAGK